MSNQPEAALNAAGLQAAERALFEIPKEGTNESLVWRIIVAYFNGMDQSPHATCVPKVGSADPTYIRNILGLLGVRRVTIGTGRKGQLLSPERFAELLAPHIRMLT